MAINIYLSEQISYEKTKKYIIDDFNRQLMFNESFEINIYWLKK